MCIYIYAYKHTSACMDYVYIAVFAKAVWGSWLNQHLESPGLKTQPAGVWLAYSRCRQARRRSAHVHKGKSRDHAAATLSLE